LQSTLLTLSVCALISGCAANISTRLQPQIQAARPDAPIQCGECKVEWQRAQLWVTKHSRWKIQTSTDVVIQTFNAVSSDVSYGFTITREPTASGYQLAVAVVCGNILGCDPLPADVRRAFYHYAATGQDLLDGQGYLGSVRWFKVKPKASKPATAPPGKWRIMRGDVEIEAFASEILARKRLFQLQRTVAGENTRLIRPDGTPA
jgi:hypothetical protein